MSTNHSDIDDFEDDVILLSTQGLLTNGIDNCLMLLSPIQGSSALDGNSNSDISNSHPVIQYKHNRHQTSASTKSKSTVKKSKVSIFEETASKHKSLVSSTKKTVIKKSSGLTSKNLFYPSKVTRNKHERSKTSQLKKQSGKFKANKSRIDLSDYDDSSDLEDASVNLKRLNTDSLNSNSQSTSGDFSFLTGDVGRQPCDRVSALPSNTGVGTKAGPRHSSPVKTQNKPQNMFDKIRKENARLRSSQSDPQDSMVISDTDSDIESSQFIIKSSQVQNNEVGKRKYNAFLKKPLLSLKNSTVPILIEDDPDSSLEEELKSTLKQNKMNWSPTSDSSERSPELFIDNPLGEDKNINPAACSEDIYTGETQYYVYSDDATQCPDYAADSDSTVEFNIGENPTDKTNIYGNAGTKSEKLYSLMEASESTQEYYKYDTDVQLCQSHGSFKKTDDSHATRPVLSKILSSKSTNESLSENIMVQNNEGDFQQSQSVLTNDIEISSSPMPSLSLQTSLCFRSHLSSDTSLPQLSQYLSAETSGETLLRKEPSMPKLFPHLEEKNFKLSNDHVTPDLEGMNMATLQNSSEKSKHRGVHSFQAENPPSISLSQDSFNFQTTCNRNMDDTLLRGQEMIEEDIIADQRYKSQSSEVPHSVTSTSSHVVTDLSDGATSFPIPSNKSTKETDMPCKDNNLPFEVTVASKTDNVTIKKEKEDSYNNSCSYSLEDDVVAVFDSDDEELFLTQSAIDRSNDIEEDIKVKDEDISEEDMRINQENSLWWDNEPLGKNIEIEKVEESHLFNLSNSVQGTSIQDTLSTEIEDENDESTYRDDKNSEGSTIDSEDDDCDHVSLSIYQKPTAEDFKHILYPEETSGSSTEIDKSTTAKKRGRKRRGSEAKKDDSPNKNVKSSEGLVRAQADSFDKNLESKGGTPLLELPISVPMVNNDSYLVKNEIESPSSKDAYCLPTQVSEIHESDDEDVDNDVYLAQTQIDYMVISSDEESNEEHEHVESNTYGRQNSEDDVNEVNENKRRVDQVEVNAVQEEKDDFHFEDNVYMMATQNQPNDIDLENETSSEANSQLFMMDTQVDNSFQKVGVLDEDKEIKSSSEENDMEPYLMDTQVDDSPIETKDIDAYAISTQIDHQDSLVCEDPYEVKTLESDPQEILEEEELLELKGAEYLYFDEELYDEEELLKETEVSDQTRSDKRAKLIDRSHSTTPSSECDDTPAKLRISEDADVNENNIVEYMMSTQVDTSVSKSLDRPYLSAKKTNKVLTLTKGLFDIFSDSNDAPKTAMDDNSLLPSTGNKNLPKSTDKCKLPLNQLDSSLDLETPALNSPKSPGNLFSRLLSGSTPSTSKHENAIGEINTAINKKVTSGTSKQRDGNVPLTKEAKKRCHSDTLEYPYHKKRPEASKVKMIPPKWISTKSKIVKKQARVNNMKTQESPLKNKKRKNYGEENLSSHIAMAKKRAGERRKFGSAVHKHSGSKDMISKQPELSDVEMPCTQEIVEQGLPILNIVSPFIKKIGNPESVLEVNISTSTTLSSTSSQSIEKYSTASSSSPYSSTLEKQSEKECKKCNGNQDVNLEKQSTDIKRPTLNPPIYLRINDIQANYNTPMPLSSTTTVSTSPSLLSKPHSVITSHISHSLPTLTSSSTSLTCVSTISKSSSRFSLPLDIQTTITKAPVVSSVTHSSMKINSTTQQDSTHQRKYTSPESSGTKSSKTIVSSTHQSSNTFLVFSTQQPSNQQPTPLLSPVTKPSRIITSSSHQPTNASLVSCMTKTSMTTTLSTHQAQTHQPTGNSLVSSTTILSKTIVSSTHQPFIQSSVKKSFMTVAPSAQQSSTNQPKSTAIVSSVTNSSTTFALPTRQAPSHSTSVLASVLTNSSVVGSTNSALVPPRTFGMMVRKPRSNSTAQMGILKVKDSAAKKKLLVHFDLSKNLVHHIEKEDVQSRPPLTPAIDSTTKKIKKELFCTQNDFIWQVLKWNTSWIFEQEKFRGQPPPVLGIDQQFSRLRMSYDDVLTYQKITYKLFLLEVWAMLSNAWNSYPTFLPAFIKSKPLYMTKGDEKLGLLSMDIEGVTSDPNTIPIASDVLVLDMKGKVKCSNQENSLPFKQFGFVESVKKSRLENNKNSVLYRPEIKGNFKEYLRPGAWIFSITMIIKFKGSVPFDIMRIKKLSSLTTALRQFQGLVGFAQTPLCQALINPDPCGPAFSLDDTLGSDENLSKYLNKEQVHAVIQIREAVLSYPYHPHVCLLQGPPGTGKSYTIMVLIHQILLNSHFKAKICLAAPSNAAADEIARRIIELSDKKCKPYNKQAISLVRLGNIDNVSNKMKEFHISNLTDELLRQDQQERLPKSLQDELKAVDAKILSLTADLKDTHISDAQKVSKTKELNRLKNQDKKKIEQEMNHSYEDRRKAKYSVITNCHVVCGTLSSFGSGEYMPLLRYKYANHERREPFSCLIVDEATQAVEMDCLIPLQHNINKLVLVGDQEQLPATVLSQEAKNFRFDTSLFQRLHSKFESCDKNDNPVMMLKEQYRMHPEILKLPNSYFYKNLLTTAQSSLESRTSSLSPYLVFDLLDGLECSGNHGSKSNKKEATCVGLLCERVVSLMAKKSSGSEWQKKIGVICPYTDQKREIQDILKRRGLFNILVNTVDSFQGQEKDVIILSCVRAQGNPQSVGFIDDCKRMNVALTRAKLALYIVGHGKTLSTSELWKLLYQDAKKRGLLVTVPRTDLFSDVAYKRVPLTHKIRK